MIQEYESFTSDLLTWIQQVNNGKTTAKYGTKIYIFLSESFSFNSHYCQDN